jgi:hypothetical protein
VAGKIGLDVDKISTFVEVKVETPVGDYELIRVEVPWPEAEIHWKHDFFPGSNPPPPPPIFDPNDPIKIDRSKM